MVRVIHPSKRLPVLCLLVATLPAVAAAGRYNPDRSIGDVVPAWSNLPGTDSQRHSWQDVAGSDLVVVVFTCNSCPYAVDYEDRINALVNRHPPATAGAAPRVAVVAINANPVAADALPAMQARAEARGFRFPYLFDERQEVARSFGAVRTPEFFLLDRQRRILYMGAMDDAADATQVRATFLDDAIAAALAGRGVPVAETPPVGCMIRFPRRR
jgi:peroxiredoxin